MKRRLVILVCALALSSCGVNKKEVQPPADKQGATKARLTELFQLCKDGKNAEAAEYIDKEAFGYRSEQETVSEICRDIKTNLVVSERHEFKEFRLDPPKYGGPELAIWTVAFHRGAQTGDWVYPFAFLEGKYVLMGEPSSPLVLGPGDVQKKQPGKSSDNSIAPGSGTIPILNDKATRLPKPRYPAIARSTGAAGEVKVAVTVDENGNVIQAGAISGHPLLQAAAVGAARAAKFEPSKIDGRPVQVKGMLKYEFVAP